MLSCEPVLLRMCVNIAFGAAFRLSSSKLLRRNRSFSFKLHGVGPLVLKKQLGDAKLQSLMQNSLHELKVRYWRDASFETTLNPAPKHLSHGGQGLLQEIEEPRGGSPGTALRVSGKGGGR